MIESAIVYAASGDDVVATIVDGKVLMKDRQLRTIDVRQTLAADVAQDYFTLRSLDTQAQILRENLALYRRQIQLIQQQIDAGLVTPIDLAQAQAQLEATSTQ